MDFTEDNGSRAWAEWKIAALDVWLERTAVLLNLEAGNEDPSVLSQIDGRYLLIGKNCPFKCGQNDFQGIERARFFWVLFDC